MKKKIKTSRLAIISLILSLCFFIPLINFIGSTLAIIFGFISLSQIKQKN